MTTAVEDLEKIHEELTSDIRDRKQTIATLRTLYNDIISYEKTLKKLDNELYLLKRDIEVKTLEHNGLGVASLYRELDNLHYPPDSTCSKLTMMAYELKRTYHLLDQPQHVLYDPDNVECVRRLAFGITAQSRIVEINRTDGDIYNWNYINLSSDKKAIDSTDACADPGRIADSSLTHKSLDAITKYAVETINARLGKNDPRCVILWMVIAGVTATI